MKFIKGRNLGVLLGGIVAGFIGLVAGAAILGAPTALAVDGQTRACDGCHDYRTQALRVNTDVTTATMDPGTTLAVNITWSGGNTNGTLNEVNWPTDFGNVGLTRSNTQFNPTPRIPYSGTAASGTASSVLTAPSAPGIYTLRVYASTGSGAASKSTDYKDITITVRAPVTTYTIAVSANPSAGGTVTGGGTVNSGTSVTVTATPNSGYTFANWAEGGVQVSTSASYTFNATANRTLVASFSINRYTLTYAAGPNGSLSGTLSQTVNYGTSGTAVTAIPNTGYHFVNWSDGSTANPRTDTNVTANKSVTANFAINTYTITPTAGANGSISPATATTVNHGGSQTFTITPSTGYHVANVLVDGASVGAVTTYTFTNVQANHAILASFALDAIPTFNITASSGSNGSISPSGAVTVNSGASQTFTISANTGYHVANVLVDGTSVGAVATYTFSNVTTSHTISASFAINTYTLSYTAGPGGSITGTLSQTVNYNGSGTAVTAVPNTGYHFVNWSDGLTAATRTDSNVTANKSVTANFAADTVTSYTLTYTAGANGSISGTSPQTVASGGSGTAVTAVANTGFHFVNWSDSSTANPRTDSNVVANVSVTANFAIDTHPITASAGPNGSVTPGSVTVDHAGSATFTIVADPGYHVESIIVDGSPTVATAVITASTTYTFTNVTAAHTLEATFAADAPPAGDTAGPIVTNLKLGPKGKKTTESTLTLTAIANDSATGGSNIAQVEYWLDTSATAMSVPAGTFDSPTEAIAVQIDLAALTTGRHFIYVRAQDSAGNWGATVRIAFRVATIRNANSAAGTATIVGYWGENESEDED